MVLVIFTLGGGRENHLHGIDSRMLLYYISISSSLSRWYVIIILGDIMNTLDKETIEQLFDNHKKDNSTNKDTTLEHIVSDNTPLMTQEELDKYIYGTNTNKEEDPLISLAKNTTPEAIHYRMEKEKDPENNELYTQLMLAEYLNPEQKELYLAMTRLFVSDTRTNLFLDQFALNEKYPRYSLDNWVDYLSDRIVTAYITKHRKVRMKSIAEMQLLSPDTLNKTQSLKMLKDLETNKKDNNIVIYRIPLVPNKEDIV